MNGPPSRLAAVILEGLGEACGVASKVAEVLLDYSGAAMDQADFVAFGIARVDVGKMNAALGVFQRVSWAECQEGRWRATPALPTYAPVFLAGASAMMTHCGPTTRTRSIITMPGGRSDLQAALGGLGLAHLAMETTREAFAGLARCARDSFVVMTPFLNEQGLDWALGLFEGCCAKNLTLITRLTNGTTALIQSKHETLSVGRIKVMNYRIEHGQNSYETFHAKVILADRTSAYVGSANLLDYERSSLELGVLLDGPDVHPIAELVDAVVAVSRPIWPTGHGGGEINVGQASPEPGLAAVCP